VELGKIHQLLEHAHLGIEAALFGHVAEPAAGFEGDGRAAPENVSSIGTEHAHHDPHGGGLARAVAAHKAKQLTGAHVEAEVLEGDQTAVPPRQAIDVQRAIRHWSRGTG